MLADKLLQSGFRSPRAGISIAIDDMLVPGKSTTVIERAERGQGDRAAVRLGLVTAGERYNKVVDIWGKAGDEIGKKMMDHLKVEKTFDRNGKK